MKKLIITIDGVQHECDEGSFKVEEKVENSFRPVKMEHDSQQHFLNQSEKGCMVKCESRSYETADVSFASASIAEGYAFAINTHLQVLQCEGIVEPYEEPYQEPYGELQWIIDSDADTGSFYSASIRHNYSFCFDTKENAKKCIDKIGKLNIINMYRGRACIPLLDKLPE